MKFVFPCPHCETKRTVNVYDDTRLYCNYCENHFPDPRKLSDAVQIEVTLPTHQITPAAMAQLIKVTEVMGIEPTTVADIQDDHILFRVPVENVITAASLHQLLLERGMGGRVQSNGRVEADTRA